ncbi:MAG: hypothetical protein HY782_01535 [Chloroflexi bacterium]|nr:hypothetical protein [Chloroflexota bacterium]
MNFQEAEKAYQSLRAQYSAGKLNNTDFEAEVSKLKVQDTDGRWWQIGVQSGDWYVHDGQKWSKAKPPAVAPPPVQPAAPPEGTPVIATSPAPPTPTPTPKAPRGGKLTPRLFSAAPAGRGNGGGLPTPILVGIIAVVALVGIGIIVAAYLLLSGQSRGLIAGATGTPTRAPVVIVPTSVLPTLPPPPPTNTPVVLPTVAITSTGGLTTTVPATRTAVLTTTVPTTGTVRATATRRPATATVAAVPAATKAPALAPNVYVSKLRTAPAQPNAGDPVTYYVTFNNTTNNLGPTPWMVKVFRCEAACTGDELRVNRSIGETPRSNANILPGTSELAVGPLTIGAGACNLVAIPYYVDPASGSVLPFLPTNGQDRLYYNFKLCP